MRFMIFIKFIYSHIYIGKNCFFVYGSHKELVFNHLRVNNIVYIVYDCLRAHKGLVFNQLRRNDDIVYGIVIVYVLRN